MDFGSSLDMGKAEGRKEEESCSKECSFSFGLQVELTIWMMN